MDIASVVWRATIARTADVAIRGDIKAALEPRWTAQFATRAKLTALAAEAAIRASGARLPAAGGLALARVWVARLAWGAVDGIAADSEHVGGRLVTGRACARSVLAQLVGLADRDARSGVVAACLTRPAMPLRGGVCAIVSKRQPVQVRRDTGESLVEIAVLDPGLEIVFPVALSVLETVFVSLIGTVRTNVGTSARSTDPARVDCEAGEKRGGAAQRTAPTDPGRQRGGAAIRL